MKQTGVCMALSRSYRPVSATGDTLSSNASGVFICDKSGLLRSGKGVNTWRICSILVTRQVLETRAMTSHRHRTCRVPALNGVVLFQKPPARSCRYFQAKAIRPTASDNALPAKLELGKTGKALLVGIQSNSAPTVLDIFLDNPFLPARRHSAKVRLEQIIRRQRRKT